MHNKNIFTCLIWSLDGKKSILIGETSRNQLLLELMEMVATSIVKELTPRMRAITSNYIAAPILNWSRCNGCKSIK